MKVSHVVPEPKEISFTKFGHTGKIFPQKNLTNKASFCLINTENGLEVKIIEHQCDFIYYILKGKGYFEIDGQKENCSVGDLVIIPAGKIFTFKGNLQMFLTITPPFFPEQDETLPE